MTARKESESSIHALKTLLNTHSLRRVLEMGWHNEVFGNVDVIDKLTTDGSGITHEDVIRSIKTGGHEAVFRHSGKLAAKGLLDKDDVSLAITLDLHKTIARNAKILSSRGLLTKGHCERLRAMGYKNIPK